MSAREKREKTSSADSGSSQNYIVSAKIRNRISITYTRPIWVIRRYIFLLGKLEDALLED